VTGQGIELKRVLVANRGEIALRIVRACHDSGLTAIAVYADQDADAPFVRAAEEAVGLRGVTAAQTYLDIDKLIAAAAQTAADAVHPGYGFLAENAGFARAVTAAGLIWIGPPPVVIEALGDKLRAREIAARVGAPMVPGTIEPITDPAQAVVFAQRHGLPIAIKAAFGGGGRGLRIAREVGEVAELFESAVREASAAFGRGDCFVESYVEGGRHLEAQVLADAHGAVRVVGTRDCTLQRRYQKLVEEAPAPFLTAGQRELLERSAADICRAAGYVSAGTVEFLLSPRGELSFLEVNTRLQVEHTVTEETSDLDLVREQLRIAAGHPLAGPEPPATPTVQRHAIEFRINAEDPERQFAPSTGTITRFRPPGGPGVRLDSGVDAESVVEGQFDSLLAKLIVTGRDRTQALERARRALTEFEIDGVRTTLPFLRAVVDEPAFTGTGPDGFAVHTRWIEQEYLPSASARAPAQDEPDDRVAVPVGGRWLSVAVPGLATAAHGPLARAREQARQHRERTQPVAADIVTAPMQGTVVRLAVAEGDDVAAGQLVAVVEAMKMENPLHAPAAGQVKGLAVTVGQTVAQGAVLCRLVSGRADSGEFGAGGSGEELPPASGPAA
jgi:acetyl-CoA/propionyl-CoA carboxylase biotin carboxyl carrier protein